MVCGGRGWACVQQGKEKKKKRGGRRAPRPPSPAPASRPATRREPKKVGTRLEVLVSSVGREAGKQRSENGPWGEGSWTPPATRHRLCLVPLRRGHANLLCICPSLTDVVSDGHKGGREGLIRCESKWVARVCPPIRFCFPRHSTPTAFQHALPRPTPPHQRAKPERRRPRPCSSLVSLLPELGQKVGLVDEHHLPPVWVGRRHDFGADAGHGARRARDLAARGLDLGRGFVHIGR